MIGNVTMDNVRFIRVYPVDNDTVSVNVRDSEFNYADSVAILLTNEAAQDLVDRLQKALDH